MMIEYLTEHVDALNDDTLNELGKTGWQLVTIYDDIAYFTRTNYDPPFVFRTIVESKSLPVSAPIDVIGKRTEWIMNS